LWGIIVNGNKGVLNISGVDSSGKLTGTIFGHPIINGTWNQINKNATFTESIPSGPSGGSVLYTYEGFLTPLCSVQQLHPLFVCDQILAGITEPQQKHLPIDNPGFGWVAVWPKIAYKP
jgi:hypothetical protein